MPARRIDEILDKACITKGGFFYHFSGKKELARALVDRYLENDSVMFAELLRQGRSSSAKTPYSGLLIFLNLLTETVAGMTEIHPGCLVAAFAYETQQFDDDIRRRIEQGMLQWRELIAKRLRQIMQNYEARVEVDVDVLADMFSSSLEGGIILARVLNSNQALVDQMQAYRTHLRLLFDNV
ncbi:MAG: TetR/AcrR family transcriptional regulator [Porticoccaceae bacterium]